MAHPLIHEAFVPSQKADLEVDIAVVGAGIAGAYSAWRLKERYPEKHVALFEYSNRVGGRLYSVPLPGMPNINAELGGCATSRSAGVRPRADRDLGLANRDFPMGRGRTIPAG